MTPQQQVDALFEALSPSEFLRLWDYFQLVQFPKRDPREELLSRMPSPSIPPPLPKDHTRVRAVAK